MYWKTSISYLGETLNEGGKAMEAITCAWALAYGGNNGLKEGLGRKLFNAKKWQSPRWRHVSINGKENNQYKTKEFSKNKKVQSITRREDLPTI